jgi:TATA-box binding protein (TBP) (component of TFIID and TFIIIB)
MLMRVIIAKSEDDLQRAVNKLNTTVKKYGIKMSSSKTKKQDFVVKICKWSK